MNDTTEKHAEDCPCDDCLRQANDDWIRAYLGSAYDLFVLDQHGEEIYRYLRATAFNEAVDGLIEKSERLAALLNRRDAGHDEDCLCDDCYLQAETVYHHAILEYEYVVWMQQDHAHDQEIKLRVSLLQAVDHMTKLWILRHFPHGGVCCCESCQDLASHSDHLNFRLHYFGGKDELVSRRMRETALVRTRFLTRHWERLQNLEMDTKRAMERSKHFRSGLKVALQVLCALALTIIGLTQWVWPWLQSSKKADDGIALGTTQTHDRLEWNQPSMPITLTADRDDTRHMVCIPGHQITCACQGALVGIQVCDSDGSGFSACRCPSD